MMPHREGFDNVFGGRAWTLTIDRVGSSPNCSVGYIKFEVKTHTLLRDAPATAAIPCYSGPNSPEHPRAVVMVHNASTHTVTDRAWLSHGFRVVPVSVQFNFRHAGVSTKTTNA
jgi:hypothetical protein